MYNTIIIDDEYMILKGLPKIINWSSYGFQIAGTFRSGAEALNWMKTNSVDLVITDISMPKMSGIDFITQAQKINNNFVFLILSGYEEFDYVKSGMQLGAIDYLVKPVDPEELGECLNKATAILKKNKKEKKIQQIIVERQTEQLINDELNEKEKRLFLNQVGLDADSKVGWTVVCCNIIENAQDLIKYFTSINQLLHYQANNQLVVCYWGTNTQLMKTVNELEARQLISGKQFLTLGQTVKDINLIGESYEQAQSLFEAYLFYEKKYVFSTEIERKNWLAQAALPKISITEFQQAVALGDKQAMQKNAQRIFKNLEQKNISPSYVKQIAFLMFLELDKKSDRSQNEYEKKVVLLNRAEHLKDIEKILENLIELFKDGIKESYSPNVKSILKIVEENYSKDLSLHEVSLKLHLNAMYLGQLFKKETKISFTKYLNQYRIKKAQAFLRSTNESIASIGLMTGYRNTGYFYKNFHLICGLSPKEYREKYQQL